MKNALFALALGMAATSASAQSIGVWEFPWKNAQDSSAVYNMADHADAVFVFEGYSINCGPCNSNAVNVDALATKYKDEPRVQVLDMGLDANDSDFTRWISKHKPNHPVVKDVNRRVYNALKTDNLIPQVFVVNCKGEKIFGNIGVWTASVKAALDRAIAEGLATDCTPTEK